MIREVIMHTDAMDIPQGYVYDTETPDFYVYRHKYTGHEIHRTKNPPLYVNIQPYINEVLDKIKTEIEEHVRVNSALNVDRARALCWCLDVIDKYKGSEGGKE